MPNFSLTWNWVLKFFSLWFLVKHPSYNSELSDGPLSGLSILKKMDFFSNRAKPHEIVLKIDMFSTFG